MLDRSNVLQFLFTIHFKKTDHLKFTELQPCWSVMPFSVTMTNWIFFVLMFCFVIFNLGCQGRLSVLFSPNKDGNISQVNSHHFYGPLLWTDMVFHLCFYEE